VPEFSIIVPSYDHGAYVGQAIESALAQEDVDFEVIVIDDGSTDDSRRVIEPFAAHPRLRVVLQENQGISHVFNRGLDLARGAFVGFLCSDDRWLPRHLAHARSAFREQGRDCSFVWGRARVIDGDGNPVPEFRSFRPPTDADLFRQLSGGNFIPFISVVARREHVERVGGFDNAIGVLQDYDLWLRLLTRGTAHYHGRETVLFRWHGANASGPGPERYARKRRDTVHILRKVLTDHRATAARAGTVRQLERALTRNYVLLAQRTGDRAEKGTAYLQAWRRQPWKLDHFLKGLWYAASSGRRGHW